ncbi:BQ5605_C019g08845 [Microbotryum silenes-dioicae]|uniref:BQ5605_C019g08845 protein n=1 Tax=Microbotryum silenes-dioicae TaxID=796604 RepID=A0A2X0LZW1_9BASI|nr:BQ5605_C019g08845 [Microbotryum silenes-dioicae]
MVDQFFNKARPFTKRQREPTHGELASSSSSRGGGRRSGFGGRSSAGGAAGSGKGRRDDGGGSGSAFHNKKPRTGNAAGNAKGKANASNGASTGRRRRDEEDDDDLNDDKFDSDDQDDDDDDEDEFEEEQDDPLETPAQKRLRLSQMYLDSLAKAAKGQDEIGCDAADVDRDIIAERLQQDVLQHSGKLHLFVANKLILPLDPTHIHHTPRKAHRGPLTSAIASQDAHWLYTASKDGSIIKWHLSTRAHAVGSALDQMEDGESTSERKGSITKAVYLPKRKRDPTQIANKEESAKAKGKKKALNNSATAVGHAAEVLSLDLSTDGTILASGGADKVIGVWNVKGENAKWVRGLSGHKDRVASLAFRQGTQELYSSSFDRTIKLYDLSTLSYVETLFGHQDSIQHIAALRGELAVSAGGRDKTVRYWKVAEESQLVFRGGVVSRVRNVLDGAFEEDDVAQVELERRKRKERGEVKYVEGSIECVAMVDDTTFLSGGDSGSICLWTTTKKKPVASRQLAHGTHDTQSATEGLIATPRWITALACLPYGDVFASGSWDGSIRLWKIDEKMRSFEVLGEIPAVGYVNSLQIVLPNVGQTDKEGDEKTLKGKSLMLVASISKEPRLGRWKRLKEGREGALVVEIPLREV